MPQDSWNVQFALLTRYCIQHLETTEGFMPNCTSPASRVEDQNPHALLIARLLLSVYEEYRTTHPKNRLDRTLKAMNIQDRGSA